MDNITHHHNTKYSTGTMMKFINTEMTVTEANENLGPRYGQGHKNSNVVGLNQSMESITHDPPKKLMATKAANNMFEKYSCSIDMLASAIDILHPL